MAMEFNGEFESERPPKELWDYFTDTDHLGECAPGLKEINRVSPSEIEAVITVSVGSVNPTFSVDGTVTKADRPNELVIMLEGSGNRNAFEAVGTMEMIETDHGAELQWQAETSVSGLLSSLGQRALGSVTERLVGQFFDCMEGKIEEDVPAESKLSADSDAKAEL